MSIFSINFFILENILIFTKKNVFLLLLLTCVMG